MDEIKVKAEYVVRDLDSRFVDLENALELAQNTHKQTKEVVVPIIKEEGKARYFAIIDQLKPYMDFMRKHDNVFTSRIEIPLFCKDSIRRYFSIGGHDILFSADNFYSIDQPKENSFSTLQFCKNYWYKYVSEFGLFTNWNSYGIVEKVDRQVRAKMEEYIKDINRKTEEILNAKKIMEQ